jgi:serine phosphatase RsbU (regulator of sigma subunit)/lipopolysaccharide biosynthesis regulator YciM
MSRFAFFPVFLLLLFFTCALAVPFSIFAQTPKIDSLLNVLKTQKEDTSKANTLFELTRAYLFELEDNQKIGEFGSQELELSLKLNFKKGIGYGYLNRGIFYRNTGDYHKAMVFDKKALAVMKETGNKKGEGSCYLNIGLTHSYLGNYKEALEFMQKGIQIKTLLQEKRGMAGGYNNIGNIYYTQGNFREALNYFLKAQKIREEQHDKVGLSMVYNNIGNVFNALDKYEDAFLNYKKALKIHEELKNQSGMGSVYTNIGNLYGDKGNFTEALVNYFKGLSARESIDDKYGIAESYYKIGHLYFNLKNYKEALSYQLKSLLLFQKIGNKKGVADVSGGLGNVYEAKKDFKKALYYYDQMLSLSKELNYPEGISYAYEDFTTLYKKQKQFEKALEYTTLYNTVKDSMLNKENFKQVSELNTRYETEKKEKEILLLTKDQELNVKIIRQQQLIRWGLTGGVLLLFISIFSIYRRYRFKQRANEVLETQNKEILEKNLLITDSIDYAKTIQEAVLPTQSKIQSLFPDSFILSKPKSIVSGDFYWVNKTGNQLVCAVADCTGHGVPGAFMSLLGYNMLENEVKKNALVEPALILDHLNAQVIKSLSKEEQEVVKHGMDISLISIDASTNVLNFSGAHNSIYIIRDEQLTELKADKKGIGFISNQNNNHFTNQIFQLKKGDMIYLHTDGFPDQIGGNNRKKFYYRPFKDLLISISSLDLQTQKKKLDEAHVHWMGDKMDQTDDILIMGIRI